jgi:cobalt-zinc-cadmium efflux system protein
VRGQGVASQFPGDKSARRSRRLSMAVGANLLIAGGEVVGGSLAHSMALLSDAGHNAADVAAAGLALVAVYLARKPPTTAKSYGWHRSGVLAAQLNAAGVLVISFLIVVGAVDRLLHPQAVDAWVVVWTAAGAVVLNALTALLVAERGGRGGRGGPRDLNMRAVLLHSAADTAGSAGVVIAGVVLLAYPHLRAVDPAVSLGIAVLVGAQALRLGRQVSDVLLEATPAGTDVAQLSRAVAATPGVAEVHDLHVWSLSTEVVLLSAHLVMEGHPTLEDAQDVAGSVRARLAGEFGIAHATLELECETCADGMAGPCAMTGPTGRRRRRAVPHSPTPAPGHGGASTSGRPLA